MSKQRAAGAGGRWASGRARSRVGGGALLVAAAAASVVALGARRAAAQTWVGPGGGVFSGSFQTASNWNPAAVPQPTSTASFALNQSYTVTFATNAASSALVFSNSSGVTTFGGSGATRAYTILNNATFAGGGTAVLGNLDLTVLGALAVRNNSFVRVLGASSLTAGLLSLGDAGTGATATLSVEGTEFDLLNETFHNIGRLGDTGTLTFSNKAAGNLLGGLALGDSNTAAGGKGFLNVLSGSVVTTEAINGATDSLSTQVAGITVSGAGSTLMVTNGGSIVLGSTSLSKATFDVLAGATANLRHTGLLLNPTATMTVDNATLLTSGQVNVTGLLTVTNGAHLTHNETTGSFNGFNVGLPGTSGSNTVNIGGAGTTVTINGFGISPGTVNQSGGAVNSIGFFNVGAVSGTNGAGTYQLSGGSLTSDSIFLAGLQAAGTFVQSGGTHTVNALLRVAANNGGLNPPRAPVTGTAIGTYTLSGGRVTAPTVWVGNSSKGIVNQSGGAMNVTGELTLGGLVEDSAVLIGEGTYTLSGSGSLTAPVERVGWTTVGTLTQSGGSNAVTTRLIVADTGDATGTYNLSGGTLDAPVELVGNSGKAILSHSGGVNTVGTLTLGADVGGDGTYAISGSASLVATDIQIGQAFTSIGPAPAGPLGATADGALAAASTLPGAGTFTQKNNSTVTVADTLAIGNEAGPGRYTFSAGTLTARRISIGGQPFSNYFQSGGTATAQFLTIGAGLGVNQASGAIGGGTLHVTGPTIIGFNESGFFQQSGGATQFDGGIQIGSDGGSFNSGTGHFQLLAGTLTTPRIDVGPFGTFEIGGGGTNVVRIDNVTLNVSGTFTTFSGTVGISGNATFGPASKNTIGDRLALSGNLTLQNATIAGPLGRLIADAASRVTGSGMVTASVDNAGILEASAGSLVIQGNSLNNTGTLRNAVGATLFLKAASFTNAGSVQVSGGGSVVVDQPLPINAGKSLTLAGGTLGTPRVTNAVGGTVSGFGQITGDLDNAGAITFLGPTQIVGNFTNRAGATLLVRNDQTLVTGQSVNNGTITTVNGKVVFDGGLTTPVAGPALGAAAAPAPGGGGVDGVGTLSLSGPSTLVTSYVRQRSLTLAGTTPATPAVASVRPKAFGGQTSVVNEVSIPLAGSVPLGRLDLVDTALVVDYATTDASPLASVRALVIAGFHGGDWSGNGIASSAAAADRGKALGYGEAADALHLAGSATAPFVGVTADASTVLVRYTLAGDATLDGVVDFNDLVKLAQNYNTGTGEKLWSQGDVTYDGVVDFNDLVKLAQNYNTALPPAGPIPGAPADFGADLARAFANVPEPTGLPLLSVACGWMAARSRRR